MRMKHKFRFTLSDAFMISICLMYLMIAAVSNYHVWFKDYPVQESTIKINKKSR